MGGDAFVPLSCPLAAEGMADDMVYCAEAGGVEGEQKAAADEFCTKFKASSTPMCRFMHLTT